MVVNGFNSDDYLYLEVLLDIEGYKKGDILRFKISD